MNLDKGAPNKEWCNHLKYRMLRLFIVFLLESFIISLISICFFRAEESITLFIVNHNTYVDYFFESSSIALAFVCIFFVVLHTFLTIVELIRLAIKVLLSNEGAVELINENRKYSVGSKVGINTAEMSILFVLSDYLWTRSNERLVNNLLIWVKNLVTTLKKLLK